MSSELRHNLRVEAPLVSIIENEVLPGTRINPDRFWSTLASLFERFGSRNSALLETRSAMQNSIDNWHREHAGEAFNQADYQAFLTGLGYIVDEGPDFQITVEDTDPEVGTICGPQLVVPSTNPRFALNAANARWGSLYDALYGTDAMGTPPPPGAFDEGRGNQVITWARQFLDQAVPLAGASHAHAKGYSVQAGSLLALVAGEQVPLQDPAQFCGHTGDGHAPDMVVLRNNELHLLLDFDADHRVGSIDDADIADIRLEAAVSTIIDCEDSVAVVDADDKVAAYRTWLGLMKGDLSESFVKSGETVTRRLSDDIAYTDAVGNAATLKGRALMFVRNVGHLMTFPAVQDQAGRLIPEGILDALCTVTIALHDIHGDRSNSFAGSIYVVKPKMHGPEEVAFADDLFAAIEDALGLARNTVKLGIMDEERRTSINLKECIRAAAGRVAFINTGFLDRTGDEIHSSMEAGPMVRKADMKSQPWFAAYEACNVEIALACGFQGRAQIGKGMWAAPDRMAEMLDAKIGHPLAGANCAWVPSPTAAVLHATHYHRIDVPARQDDLLCEGAHGTLGDLLAIPVAVDTDWSEAEIREEVENNVQGILGYTVRWVDQGIGCSKVPDINGVAQMEDRATCRISAQHLANWLHHGIVSREQLQDALVKMAAVVDSQNKDDPAYRPMDNGEAPLAFQAAAALVLNGRNQPSGYTEPLLHRYRQALKASGKHASSAETAQ